MDRAFSPHDRPARSLGRLAQAGMMPRRWRSWKRRPAGSFPLKSGASDGSAKDGTGAIHEWISNPQFSISRRNHVHGGTPSVASTNRWEVYSAQRIELHGRDGARPSMYEVRNVAAGTACPPTARRRTEPGPSMNGFLIHGSQFPVGITFMEGRPPWRPQTGGKFILRSGSNFMAVTEHGPPCTKFGTLQPGLQKRQAAASTSATRRWRYSPAA